MEKKEETNIMEYKYLGNTGMMVPLMTFGTMTFTDLKKFDDYYEIFKKAYDMGMNMFDTAEVYGFGGSSEILLGKCIKKYGMNREDVIVSTKIFWAPEAKFGTESRLVNATGLSRKHIIEGLRNSLKRLQLDYADIVFAHRPDSDTPMEETCRAFDWCIRKGLCLYWGTSQWTPYEIENAIGTCKKHRLHAPVADQCQYNMFNREEMEVKFMPLFEDYNYGTTVWSPLAGGMLTGKYLDGIPEDSRVKTMHFGKRFVWDRYMSEDKKDNTVKCLNALKVIADELECNMATLAMAWVLKYDKVSTVLVGATKLKYFDDFESAMKLRVKLTKDVEKKINDALGNTPSTEFDCREWKNRDPVR